MTDILTRPPSLLDMEPAPHRRRWTRKECEFLEKNGLLPDRYELINGDIIYKMGQNPPHALTIMLITAWLMRIFGDTYVRCQLAMEVGIADPEINGPEPDAVALNRPVTAFTANHPGPADVLLVVEVSDTTLRFDLTTKALLYARAGIVEYWAADVTGRRFIVHRNPSATGYGDVTEHNADAEIACLAHPTAAVRVADLLPPALEVTA